ncbi:MAG: ribbon-helix-helix domain-containing protein [Gemmatimonadaceae bacterium]|jgi:hypothetical protein|nr:ribbon-helix-helix domain-containing protein [Gemmatimonadaceae bacterium]
MATRHTTVRLPDALLKRVKTYAERQGLTVTAVMERALVAYVAGGAARGGYVLPPASTGEGITPGLSLDDNATIRDAMDGIR